MSTNVGIDDKLLDEAMRLGKHRTKKATVNEALAEYIQRRRRLKVLEHFGKIDFHPAWNYKAEREKR